MERLTGHHYEVVIDDDGDGTHTGAVVEKGGTDYGATPEWTTKGTDRVEVIAETADAFARYERWAA